jgi:hypothetical protein
MMVILKTTSCCYYIKKLLIINKKMLMYIYVTRKVVAEVIPSAWPLSIFIPSTFNLRKHDMYIIILCIYQTNN